MSFPFALCLLLLVAVITSQAAAYYPPPFGDADNGPIVSVTGGLVQGSQDNYSYYFKGIPFAAPPVGSLRFRDPQPVPSWTGVKPATQFSPGCIQQCILPRPEFTCPSQTSEDCLYLNVFTPTTNSSASLPVMAWIHGGAFLAGSGGTTLYEASQLAQREQMVVVTSNYRLGVFGALYNGQDITGNFMLKDQRVVLQWIQANIRAFGGNPQRVTIAGQSAGAISVGCHLTSPLSHGYFQAAIMSSNPFGIMMSTMDLMKWLHNSLATTVGCVNKSGGSTLSCMQSLDVNVLLNASLNARYVPLPNYALASILPWVPVVTNDNQLPMQPLYAADPVNGTIPSNINVMMGTAAQDGLFFVYEAIESNYSFWIVKLLLDYIFSISIANKIEDLYGSYSDSSDMHQWVGKVLTDYMFYCPSRYFARSMTNNRNSTVYGWYMGQVPSFSEWIWGDSVAPGCVEAVCHSDDLPYVFRSNLYGKDVPNPTPAEDQMVNMIQDAYGTFIATAGESILPPSSERRDVNSVLMHQPQKHRKFKVKKSLQEDHVLEKPPTPFAAHGKTGVVENAPTQGEAISNAASVGDKPVLHKAVRRLPDGYQTPTDTDAYTPWPPMYKNGHNNLLLDWLAPTSVLMEGFRDDACDYFDSIGYNRY